jgi:hypothetical protein
MSKTIAEDISMLLPVTLTLISLHDFFTKKTVIKKLLKYPITLWKGKAESTTSKKSTKLLLNNITALKAQ